ncbi:hypothetical protein MKX01_008556 [Papaver californicum]|nr:hypothetical protein MKX01_008556 [Papaver californicum]
MATVTDEDVRSYHRIDRELYSRLLIELCRDPFRSMDIIAFWMCLEHVCYPNVVLKMIKLKDRVLNSVADEAILILSCITSKIALPKSKSKNLIPLTLSLMDNKEISLVKYENKCCVISGISDKVDEVCIKVFYDILLKALEKNPSFRHQPTGGLNFGADKYRRELFSLNNLPTSSSNTKNAPKGDRRMMFVTFSRGFPTSDRELIEYFVGLYGNCVERVHQQEKKQPQYARVVFHSAKTIKTFLGGQEKVKFTINGKQLCARRYQQNK